MAATAICKIRIISVSGPRNNQTILVRFPGRKAFEIQPRVLLIKKRERKKETHKTSSIDVFVTSPPRGSFALKAMTISFLVRSHCFVERVGIVRGSNAFTLAVSNATLFGLVEKTTTGMSLLRFKTSRIQYRTFSIPVKFFGGVHSDDTAYRLFRFLKGRRSCVLAHDGNVFVANFLLLLRAVFS